MKTTIYELLGMIKDCKAPKVIVYEDKVYHYEEEYKDYVKNGNGYCLFSDDFEKHYGVTSYLLDKVEILETTLNTENMNITPFEIKNNEIHGTWKNGIPYHYTLSSPQMAIAEKLLEVINYINGVKDE